MRRCSQGGTFTQGAYYEWKNWRGPAWLRPSLGAQWGASLISGWGPFEMIDMCNALGFQPIITTSMLSAHWFSRSIAFHQIPQPRTAALCFCTVQAPRRTLQTWWSTCTAVQTRSGVLPELRTAIHSRTKPFSSSWATSSTTATTWSRCGLEFILGALQECYNDVLCRVVLCVCCDTVSSLASCLMFQVAAMEAKAAALGMPKTFYYSAVAVPFCHGMLSYFTETADALLVTRLWYRMWQCSPTTPVPTRRMRQRHKRLVSVITWSLIFTWVLVGAWRPQNRCLRQILLTARVQ